MKQDIFICINVLVVNGLSEKRKRNRICSSLNYRQKKKENTNVGSLERNNKKESSKCYNKRHYQPHL